MTQTEATKSEAAALAKVREEMGIRTAKDADRLNREVGDMAKQRGQDLGSR